MEDIRLSIEISREAYEIMRYNVSIKNPVCPLSQETMVRKIAEGLPEPKNSLLKHVKKGKWVWMPVGHDLAYGKLGNWCCSECHKPIEEYVTAKTTIRAIQYDYCPFCGSEMEHLDFSHVPSGKENK